MDRSVVLQVEGIQGIDKGKFINKSVRMQVENKGKESVVVC